MFRDSVVRIQNIVLEDTTFVVFLTIFFPTSWQAKWLKRNVSILRMGKQKFVCRRIVTSLNTLQTKTEGHLEDLGVISFQNCEKDVFIVPIST